MSQLRDIDPRFALIPEWNRDTFLKLEAQARSVLNRIAELQAAVARIRVQQNSFLPALRAPDDILVSIFFYAVDTEDAISYTRDLLVLTSVCSRWRAVATAFPSLWTSIRLGKPKLAPLFLARSKSAPLSIGTLRRDVPLSHPEQLTALVGPQVDRLRSLAVEMDAPELYESWVGHLAPLPAPALQKLSLSLDDSRARIVVGSPIFANDTPSLRSLSLQCIVYPPTSPLFANLRNLTLFGVFLRTGYQLQDLLEILSRSPALETLALEWVHRLGQQYRGLAPGAVQVPLARLRSFRMAALHPSAWRVIPHLATPEDATYNLAVTFYMSPTDDGQILDHPLVFKGIKFARLATDHAIPLSINLSVYREERPAELSQPALLLNARTNVLQITTVMVALDLRSIVWFEVDATNLGEGADEVFWHAVLKEMPALRTLDVLQGACIQGCLAALTPREVQNAGDEVAPCICPALEHLGLQDIGREARHSFWDALLSIAIERWNVGLPLESIWLSISRARSIPSSLSALDEWVGAVTVRRS